MPSGGKRKGAGRPKGSPNKKAVDLEALIQSHPLTKGFDPIVALSIFANGQIQVTHDAFREVRDLLSNIKRPSKDIKKAIKQCDAMLLVPILGRDCMISAAKEVAQYVYPKLRSIEISDPNGDNPFDVFATALAQAARS